MLCFASLSSGSSKEVKDVCVYVLLKVEVTDHEPHERDKSFWEIWPEVLLQHSLGTGVVVVVVRLRKTESHGLLDAAYGISEARERSRTHGSVEEHRLEAYGVVSLLPLIPRVPGGGGRCG